MHVNITKADNNEGTVIQFSFELEEDDLRESLSTNAGAHDIKLAANSARFYFPFTIDLPHPDLITLAALKIISPYVGSKFSCNILMSRVMAEAVKKSYPRIQKIAFDKILSSRVMPEKEQPAVSFSGGADSVAAAALLDADTPLILSARRQHPDIGEFEKWYSTDSNVQTLDRMPKKYKKVCVYSDCEFLSGNGSYCIYPDTYAFTIPAVLLSDYYNLTHIVTGDIWAAFTGDETIFSRNLSPRKNDLFQAVGLSIEPTINGLGEIGSLKIAEHFNLLDISTTCQYGKFQNPCMKCIKCFRKCIYAWALFDYKLHKQDLDRFNRSPAVKAFAENLTRKGISFGPSYKYCFLKLPNEFDGFVEIIKNRMINFPIDPSFVETIYYPAYSKNRPDFTIRALIKASTVMSLMSSVQIQQFESLDYRNIIK